MGTVKPTKKYIIDEELRNRLLFLVKSLLNNQIVHPMILSEIQTNLQQAETVIEEKEYDSKVEELIYYAKEMGIL